MMVDMPGGSLTLVGVFLLGLGLNLTPCVYPMISVTVALFGGVKETHHGRAFLKALVYVLGMATMYSFLGVAAALTGELFGSLLQNQWVLAAFGIFLVILAASMFEVYTFQAPAWLLNKLGNLHTFHFLKLFLSGMLVGIFAAPCIGPPIVALLTFVGTRGDPRFAFWVFFVLSLGLGAPYLILGTFTGLLKRLPKAGTWLRWVEHLFGVILLTVAAFYFALAFRPESVALVFPAGLILGGIYLGFFERSKTDSPKFREFKKSAGVVAVVVGILVVFLMPREKVVWEPFSNARLEAAKEAGAPVIMDFYADWCIPCHELENYTYSDSRVIEALNRFVRLKVDVTRPDLEEAEALAERYDIQGVPTILFFDSKGDEIAEARTSGFISAEELLAILNSPRLTSIEEESMISGEIVEEIQ